MRRDLPSGTVTFVFTDIEGSTKLLKELGPDAYAEALAEHRRRLREAFTRRGGVEVDTQGDAFFYAFPDASEAIDAARQGREALRPGPIHVRMGLHTGTPHLSEEGYVGEDVHFGARIAAAGHGGQVLLSEKTRAFAGTDVLDLGEHRLKDFGEAVWIYQLGEERFPPLKTISNTNLPRPASSFVGRERERSEIVGRLRDGARLVTLTGPGGSGKTRLGIEAAGELVPGFRNGVFWVGLATLRDPGLVEDAIVQTLGAKDGLAEHIGSREMMLLLDNFEQVVDAAAELSGLLERCPNLRVIVTSRERLRVSGEVEYPVPPLADPEAVALFCERSALKPDDTIAELCRRLDNLPLAVELAAARTNVLSPQQILERLSRRLDLFRAGRGTDSRQATLRAAIEWSHDLLTADERRLFARLAVFAGGCHLEAAEEVVDADLDTLGSLVDKSLVRRTDDRFWMLETIREYAVERLEASGEAADMRRRHAEHFLGLAEEAEPHLYQESAEWLDRLEREHDNLRAALDHLHASGEGGLALRLAGAVPDFWCAKEHFAEGRRQLERALAAGPADPTPIRAKALIGAAHMARDCGFGADAKARAEEGLALARRYGDARVVADGVFWLGQALADEGDFESARRFHEEGVALRIELGDELGALVANRMLAWTLSETGDRDGARALHEANLQRARSMGNTGMIATTIGALASYAIVDRRVENALALAAESVRTFHENGNRHGVAVELCRCAGAHAIAGNVVLAARLLACATALHEEIGSSMLPYLTQENEETLAVVRSNLDDTGFATAWEEGRTMTANAAVALAVEGIG